MGLGIALHLQVVLDPFACSLAAQLAIVVDRDLVGYKNHTPSSLCSMYSAKVHTFEARGRAFPVSKHAPYR